MYIDNKNKIISKIYILTYIQFIVFIDYERKLSFIKGTLPNLMFHFFFILGEDSLMYLYLQKQFSWSLNDFTLFNAYSTMLSGLLYKFNYIL